MSENNDNQSKSSPSKRLPRAKDSVDGKKRLVGGPIEKQEPNYERMSKLTISNKAASSNTSPKPWPMPPKYENNDVHGSQQARERSLQDLEGDYKTPRTNFFFARNQQKISKPPSQESSPLELSPVQELFVEEFDVPSSKNVFSTTANSTGIRKQSTFVHKKANGAEHRTRDVPSSIVDRYCSSPEEEVQSISEPDSDTFRFLKDDEVSSSSEKSFTLPSGIRNLFADAGADSPARNSAKSRKSHGLAIESEMFSPRLSTDGFDESVRSQNQRELSEPKALKVSAASSKPRVLRRPLGSRKKTLINLSKPPVSEEASTKSKSVSNEEPVITKVEEAVEVTKGSPGDSSTTETSGEIEVISPLLTKGVIMRAQTHKTNVNGIRKAETGKIMSREELMGDRRIVFLRESPIPKSLNPAAFSEEDDVMTRRPSSLFQHSSSESGGEEAGVPGASSNNRSPENDDGSFLTDKASLGYIFQEVQSSNSSKFSENANSSGLVNRLGSSFKKAKDAVARRSVTDIPELSNTDMVIPGTIDEAVCKICYVCRKKLGCRVFVKNTGKKIKVESVDDERRYYLRASLLVRLLGGEEPACAVNIRQSRADGMKTSFATLWDFYQRLENGLQELEAGNNR